MARLDERWLAVRRLVVRAPIIFSHACNKNGRERSLNAHVEAAGRRAGERSREVAAPDGEVDAVRARDNGAAAVGGGTADLEDVEVVHANLIPRVAFWGSAVIIHAK
jgi:hypothetical protein